MKFILKNDPGKKAGAHKKVLTNNDLGICLTGMANKNGLLFFTAIRFLLPNCHSNKSPITVQLHIQVIKQLSCRICLSPGLYTRKNPRIFFRNVVRLVFKADLANIRQQRDNDTVENIRCIRTVFSRIHTIV